jgi:hypothetical protein
MPQFFGPNGCYIDPADPERSQDPSLDCNGSVGAESGESEGAEPPPPTASLKLRGFTGPFYSSTASADPNAAPRVIGQTVTVGNDKTWSAVGLVRNERAADVGVISVAASLRGSDGQIVGTARGDALVPTARPGEPVPFELSSDIDAASVASVLWSATTTAPSQAFDRDIEAGLFTVLDPTRTEPVDDAVFADHGEPPYPYVADMSVHSLSRQTLNNVHVLVAWFDTASGALVLKPTDAHLPVPGLTPDLNTWAAVEIRDPPVALSSSTTDLAIWAYGQ